MWLLFQCGIYSFAKCVPVGAHHNFCFFNYSSPQFPSLLASFPGSHTPSFYCLQYKKCKQWKPGNEVSTCMYCDMVCSHASLICILIAATILRVAIQCFWLYGYYSRELDLIKDDAWLRNTVHVLIFYWTDRVDFNNVAHCQCIISLQSTVGYPLPLRMAQLRTSRASTQWEVLRYSSGVTKDMFQLGGWVLSVSHQMEYQYWVTGLQILLTLCAMVRENKHKAYHIWKFHTCSCMALRLVNSSSHWW